MHDQFRKLTIYTISFQNEDQDLAQIIRKQQFYLLLMYMLNIIELVSLKDFDNDHDYYDDEY